MNIHRERQIEIIQTIEEQVRTDSLQATAVIPVADFENDNRICLTSVHFPTQSFSDAVLQTITQPLRKLFPSAYCYPRESLHFTIKNIRTIENPPNFTEEDVQKAIDLFGRVIPNHMPFTIYPHKLLLFKNNLALMCTTDDALDRLILDLHEQLTCAGIPDNKRYVNTQYFFCNMTLMRFAKSPPERFRTEVQKLSVDLSLPDYQVDSVSLVTGNAAMKKLQVRGKWMLKDSQAVSQ